MQNCKTNTDVSVSTDSRDFYIYLAVDSTLLQQCAIFVNAQLFDICNIVSL